MLRLNTIPAALLILLCFDKSYSQTVVTGTYSDLSTTLTLRADSTFSLTSGDFIYPYKYQNYQNEGRWTAHKGDVILNPEKKRRVATLTLTEGSSDLTDSIEIKINYIVEHYKSEDLVGSAPASVQMITVMINGRRNFINLVHQKRRPACTFERRIKHQYVVDSLVTFRIAKQPIKTLTILTYGFIAPIELHPALANSNLLEIDVLQPVDQERTPRGKKVIIKKKEAFFYERSGNVITSHWPNHALRRVSN